MPKAVRRFFYLPIFIGAFAALTYAQTGTIEGEVKDENGQPLKDAWVKIERKDIKGNYKTKTDKKGRYIHTGLPLGTYKILLEVNGVVRDTADNVRMRLGDPVPVNFDLAAIARRQKEISQARDKGQLTEEMKREMTPEQKAAFEKQMKDQQEAMKKNKALNDAFNAGKEAGTAGNWEGAVEQFKKAAEMDPSQHVIYGNLADAYSSLAKTKAGADRDAALAGAGEAFQKAIQLKPDESGYYNNYGLLLASMKKFDEAQAQLTKAAQLDPAQAGKFYFNLGAVLTNTNQLEQASEAFKKAIEVDPNYADAYYQYGITLMGKATVGADGKFSAPPGTKEAFEKYLQLKPDGRDAEAAKGMIATLGGSVETEFSKPGAKKAIQKKKP